MSPVYTTPEEVQEQERSSEEMIKEILETVRDIKKEKSPQSSESQFMNYGGTGARPMNVSLKYIEETTEKIRNDIKKLLKNFEKDAYEDMEEIEVEIQNTSPGGGLVDIKVHFLSVDDYITTIPTANLPSEPTEIEDLVTEIQNHYNQRIDN